MKHREGVGTISCLGKAEFDSPALAREAAARRDGRNTYRCHYCGKWHVGGPRDMRRGEKLKHRVKLCGDPNV